MRQLNHDMLSVWPEQSSNQWIVSETQPGTNNELVLGRFNTSEAAEAFYSHLQNCTYVFVNQGGINYDCHNQA